MSALKPDAVDTHELGTSALPWKNLHIDAVTIGARSTGANVPSGSEVVIGSNAKLTADPSVPVDVEIYGSLTVHGNTTTISSTSLTISDKDITVAQGAADSAAANGAGLIVDGASASLLYSHAGTQWELNKPLEVAGSVLPEDSAKATADLGSTTLPWNDLHLSSGGVINFNNGDVTATHSANLLTVTGGNTRVDRLEIDSANDHIDIDVNTNLRLTASAGIVLDAEADIVLDADGDDITFKAGAGDSTGLKWSQSNSGDWTNLVGTQDKDLIFQVNDGGVPTEVMRLDGDVSSLLMAGTSKIEFGDAGSFVHQSVNGKLAISSDGAAADAVKIISSNAAGGIDIDAGTGGITIDSTGAYAITAAGNSTISTTGTGTLTIDSGGALVIDTDGTDSIDLGTEEAAKTITIGNDASTKVDVNALAIELDSAGSIVLDSVTTTDIDAAGILSLNSSAAAINIGNDDVAQPINIGTGAAARTITVGNASSTEVDINAILVDINAGASGFTMDGGGASSVSTSAGALTISGNAGLILQEDGINVIAIDTNRDVLFSQTGGSTVDPDVEFDGYVRFDGSSEFDGAVQVDGTLTANAAVSVKSTLTVGEDDTGYDVKLFGATSGQFLLWDESADELVLAGDSKLSFHDAAGGENIIASADGHLEVNAGTTLDMTAPTVDINASTAVTVESATFTLGSVNVATDLNPTLTIQHTGNNANGGTLKFVKDKGAAGAQGDDAGVIQFWADNAVQEQTEFARVTAEVQTATNGQEGGKLSLSVAEHDGTMTAGLVLTEGSADGVIDVTIGAGLGSTTTIAGNLTVSGTTTTVNSTELTVADDLITVSKGNDTVANADGSGLEIDVTGGTNLHWKYVHARTALSANTDIDVDSGKVFRINGTAVLSSDTLGSDINTAAGLTAIGSTAGALTISSQEVKVYDARDGEDATLSIGAADAERLKIESVYDDAAQTLDKVTFSTYAASETVDKGKFVFAVDESDTVEINDNGLKLLSGKDLRFHQGAVIADAPTTLSITKELLQVLGDVSIRNELQLQKSELTLDTDGEVTITRSYHTLDTFENAASDDLTTINGAHASGGTILILQAANTDRTVVLKDGTGNLELRGDFSLDTTDATITLIYDGSKWREVSRSHDDLLIAGDLTVQGNDLSFGNGATIVNTDASTLTITEASTVLSGDLTVEGSDIVLGTATGGATSITVPAQTTANTAGHALTISAGEGNGSGAGGSLIFQTAPAGAADSGAGTSATALTIDSTKHATFAGAITVTALSSLDGGANINDKVTIDANNGDYLSTNGDLTLTNGNLTLTSGDLEVGGDLTVSSALSSNGTELTIKDSHVLFASSGANNISAGQTFDMGFYAKRDSASASSHVGLIYDNETTGAKWRLHEGLSAPDGITGKFDFSGSTASALELGQIHLNDYEQLGANQADGTVSTSKHATLVTTGGDADIDHIDLGVGTEGQVKVIILENDGTDNLRVDVAAAGWAGGAGTITLQEQGHACTLQYINSYWWCIGNNGCTFA